MELLNGLLNWDDEGMLLECLRELNEVLTLGQVEIRIPPFVPVLIQCIKRCENNSEVLLLATRSLNIILDIDPKSGLVIISEDTLPLLCNKLVEFKDFEVAEQCLNILSFLTKHVPYPPTQATTVQVDVAPQRAVLRAEGLNACTAFFDFFPKHLQLKAMETVSDICNFASDESSLDRTKEDASYVLQFLPVLHSCLEHGDPQIVHFACISLSRLVQCYEQYNQGETTDGELQWYVAMVRRVVPEQVAVKLLSFLKGKSDPSLLSLVFEAIARVFRVCPERIVALVQNGLLLVLSERLESTSEKNISRDLERIRRVEQDTSSVIDVLLNMLPPVPEMLDTDRNQEEKPQVRTTMPSSTGILAATSVASSSSPAQQQLPSQQQQPEDVPPSSSSTSTLDIWACAVCTFHNKTNVSSCEMCGQVCPEIQNRIENAKSTEKPSFSTVFEEESKISVVKSIDIIRSHPEIIEECLLLLSHHLLRVTETSSVSRSRQNCLNLLASICYNVSLQSLQTHNLPLCSIASALYTKEDNSLVLAALKVIHVSIRRIPKKVAKGLRREGVIERLVEVQLAPSSNRDVLLLKRVAKLCFDSFHAAYDVAQHPVTQDQCDLCRYDMHGSKLGKLKATCLKLTTLSLEEKADPHMMEDHDPSSDGTDSVTHVALFKRKLERKPRSVSQPNAPAAISNALRYVDKTSSTAGSSSSASSSAIAKKRRTMSNTKHSDTCGLLFEADHVTLARIRKEEQERRARWLQPLVSLKQIVSSEESITLFEMKQAALVDTLKIVLSDPIGKLVFKQVFSVDEQSSERLVSRLCRLFHSEERFELSLLGNMSAVFEPKHFLIKPTTNLKAAISTLITLIADEFNGEQSSLKLDTDTCEGVLQLLEHDMLLEPLVLVSDIQVVIWKRFRRALLKGLLKTQKESIKLYQKKCIHPYDVVNNGCSVVVNDMNGQFLLVDVDKQDIQLVDYSQVVLPEASGEDKWRRSVQVGHSLYVASRSSFTWVRTLVVRVVSLTSTVRMFLLSTENDWVLSTSKRISSNTSTRRPCRSNVMIWDKEDVESLVNVVKNVDSWAGVKPGNRLDIGVVLYLSNQPKFSSGGSTATSHALIGPYNYPPGMLRWVEQKTMPVAPLELPLNSIKDLTIEDKTMYLVHKFAPLKKQQQPSSKPKTKRVFVKIVEASGNNGKKKKKNVLETDVYMEGTVISISTQGYVVEFALGGGDIVLRFVTFDDVIFDSLPSSGIVFERALLKKKALVGGLLAIIEKRIKHSGNHYNELCTILNSVSGVAARTTAVVATKTATQRTAANSSSREVNMLDFLRDSHNRVDAARGRLAQLSETNQSSSSSSSAAAGMSATLLNSRLNTINGLPPRRVPGGFQSTLTTLRTSRVLGKAHDAVLLGDLGCSPSTATTSEEAGNQPSFVCIQTRPNMVLDNKRMLVEAVQRQRWLTGETVVGNDWAHGCRFMYDFDFDIKSLQDLLKDVYVPGSVLEVHGRYIFATTNSSKSSASSSSVPPAKTLCVDSHFPSVSICGVWLTHGKWYYEFELTKGGLAQLGWAGVQFKGNDSKGVGCGDDEHSFAFDGSRQKKWNVDAETWGQKWKDGDVVGCAIEIKPSLSGRDMRATIRFSLNGNWEGPMGTAFENIVIVGSAVRPLLTFNRTCRGRLLIGQAPESLGATSEAKQRYFLPTKHAPPDTGYKTISYAARPLPTTVAPVVNSSMVVVSPSRPPSPANSQSTALVLSVLSELLSCLENVCTNVTSQRMTQKFIAQAQDALSVCSNSLPLWVWKFANEYKFLLPLEARLFLFQATSFGISRALYRLQKHGEIDLTGDGANRGSRASPRLRIEASGMEIAGKDEAAADFVEEEDFEQDVLIQHPRVSAQSRRKGTGTHIIANIEDRGRHISSAIAAAMANAAQNSSPSPSIPLLSKQKAVVPRSRVLEAAMFLMEHKTVRKYLLSVEFSEETGHGLGPTLEFYSLVCRELQRVHLQLWTDVSSSSSLSSTSTREASSEMDLDDEFGKFVFSPNGLWPKRIPSATLPTCSSASSTSSSSSSSSIGTTRSIPSEIKLEKPTILQTKHTRARALSLFKFMGRFIGKAFQDGRLLDLPFSLPLCKLILGMKLGLDDIVDIDESLGKSVKYLDSIWSRYDQAKAKEDEEIVRTLTATVENLCLDFTMPGDSEVNLLPGGAEISVTIENLGEYIQLLKDSVLRKDVEVQVGEIREGISEFLPIQALDVFTAADFQSLLCGGANNEKWDPATIKRNITCKHGYSKDSKQIDDLIHVLSTLEKDDRRLFVQFLTGSPRLPIGGFQELNPQLTIVRKNVERPDDNLPSCSTCQVYLKLPAYSTREVLSQRLLQAIREGQGHFALD